MTFAVDDNTVAIGDALVRYEPGVVRISWADGGFLIADSVRRVLVTGRHDDDASTVQRPLTDALLAKVGRWIAAQRAQIDAVGGTA
jgi:hypothetical protein